MIYLFISWVGIAIPLCHYQLSYYQLKYEALSWFELLCLHLEDFAVGQQHAVKAALNAGESRHPSAAEGKNIKTSEKLPSWTRQCEKTWISMEDNSGEWPHNFSTDEKQSLVANWGNNAFSTILFMSTITTKLHESKSTGFTERCKPLMSLKYRKTRFNFSKLKKNHLKKVVKTYFRLMKPRSTSTIMIQSVVWWLGSAWVTVAQD